VAEVSAGGGLKARSLRAVAFFLILWAPFFVFLADRGYPLPLTSFAYSAAFCALLAAILSALCGRRGSLRATVVFTLLAAFAVDIQFEWFEKLAAYATLLALLGLFWVLRTHLSAILAATFGALLVSTAVVAPQAPPAEQVQKVYEDDRPGAPRAEGRIIHLILDEHAGLQGIPADLPGGEALRREVSAFFIANGFRIFGNAVSEYVSSRDSISGILNFTAGPTPYDRYRGKAPYVLTQNAYFDALSAAGYTIDVHQSTYLDYCSDSSGRIQSCFTYRHDGTAWLPASPQSDLEKLDVVFGMYLQLSEIAESLLKIYARLERSEENGNGLLPRLPVWDAGPSPINGMAAFDSFMEKAVSGGDGRLYFAHLLFPHGPYAYNADCKLRGSPVTWANHRPAYQRSSSEAERATSYALYFEQLRCTMRRLQRFFDRLKAAGKYEDATIIVHGDHGSRIFTTAPRAHNVSELTPQDFHDGFATLFAIRSPAFAPGQDEATAAVSQLLARAIEEAGLARPGGEGLQVYLEDEDDSPRIAVAWPLSPRP
jgi:hypothetical protein